MTVYGGNPGGARGVYNTALCKTRNVVERSFGIWKKRFYCLDFGLRVHDMTLASKIIVCTSILHNLAIQHGDEGDDLDDLPDQGQNRSILAIIAVCLYRHHAQTAPSTASQIWCH